MMVRRFARPYARAIMDVAGSPEAAALVQGELAQFEAARQLSPDLQEVFANPGIELDAKIGIASKMAERLKFSAQALKALEVLIHNHRINDLGAISEALASYVNDATNTVVADVRTAHELTAAETTQLQQTLEKKFGKRVDVKVTSDPELLGGFVARVGSEIYDASVVGKIEKFRESLA